MTTNTKLLVIAGITIKTDSEGRYCLNDFHKAAGERPKDQPTHFLALDTTKELIAEIMISENQDHPVNIIRGRGKPQGTYVVRELVYAYAMWISPKFHLEVIRAYDRLATQGVAVHKNAAEDLLANPLKYFEVVFNEAKKLADENAKLAAEKAVLVEEKAVLQPKADTFKRQATNAPREHPKGGTNAPDRREDAHWRPLPVKLSGVGGPIGLGADLASQRLPCDCLAPCPSHYSFACPMPHGGDRE